MGEGRARDEWAASQAGGGGARRTWGTPSTPPVSHSQPPAPPWPAPPTVGQQEPVVAASHVVDRGHQVLKVVGIPKHAVRHQLERLCPAGVVVLEVLALRAQLGHLLRRHSEDEEVLKACRAVG